MGIGSLIYAFFYTLFSYHNPSGITSLFSQAEAVYFFVSLSDIQQSVPASVSVPVCLFSSYCILYSLQRQILQEKQTLGNKKNPVIGITVTLLLSLVYLIFCRLCFPLSVPAPVILKSDPSFFDEYHMPKRDTIRSFNFSRWAAYQAYLKAHQ